MPVKFIDLFCGIGGFHSGTIELDMECVFASDIDPSCRKSYHDNYGVVASGDITKIGLEDIPNHDLLCAGFPCQPFSKAGLMRGFSDERTDTFGALLNILEQKRPRVFVLENVENIIRIESGAVIDAIISALRGLGYNVSYSVLNAYNFGLPQNRARVFFIGHKQKLFDFSPLLTMKEHRVLSDILEPDVTDYINENLYTLLEPAQRKIQPKSGLVFCGYLHGHTRKNGVVESQLHLSRNHKQPYRIYHASGSHPTLSSSESSGRYFIYDGTGVRKLTVLEMYRMMGFADEFIKSPNRATAIRQIGNAVTPTITNALFKEMATQGLLGI